MFRTIHRVRDWKLLQKPPPPSFLRAARESRSVWQYRCADMDGSTASMMVLASARYPRRSGGL